MRRLLDLPLLVILMGFGCLAMLLPATHALIMREHAVGRAFLYSGAVLLILTAMIAIASANYRPRNAARSQLSALVLAYVAIPLLLAVPFSQAVPDTSFTNAWFEMVSCFTTTGATLYPGEGRLPASVHLWRAMVGWFGGFFILLSAMAILAPMNLGGAEVYSGRTPGRGAEGVTQITRIADPGARLARYALILFPVYGALTLLLWVFLMLAGERALAALCLAMGTLSTSGISPWGNTGASGLMGEMLIFVFLIMALTRRMMPGPGHGGAKLAWRDPELRLAAIVVAVVSAVLFARHWLGAIARDGTENLTAAAQTFWGAMFTTLSFLTTTGFESAYWGASKGWSGLGAPGLVLAALAIIGGGVATTAGGVKLLRVYALFRHGERELERLVHPASVGGSGQDARNLRHDGAYVAWLFFVLFALSIAVVVAALTLVRIDFEAALVLAIAALTTTGPLINVATDAPIALAGLPGAAKTILAIAMVVGRLETLAILALLAPDSWRR